MRFRTRGILLCVCISAGARADVVNLNNGDRVTGSLVTISGGNLTLKSDLMGQVTVPVAQVAAFSVSKPVAVVLKGQKPVTGSFQITPSGEWEVTAEGKAQTLAKAEVEVIMPEEAFQKTVAETARKPWQNWKGSGGLGYSFQHGNQRTNTFTTSITGVRERSQEAGFRPHWRTNFGLTTLLSHAQQSGNRVTSRTLSTNVRQDYLFAPDNFVFGLVQFDHVSTEGLYLRQTYGGGVGHDVVKNSRLTFSLLGGLTSVHEKFFTGTYNQNAEALTGEKLGLQFTKFLRFDHYLNFYPNLTSGGQYRFDSNGVLSLKLSTRLSLNTSAIDLYLSNPPPGNQKNNITFSTGIGYSF